MSGVRPRLLNPTIVKIQQADQSATKYDHLRREARNFIKRGVSFEIEAQVNWVFFENRSNTNADKGGIDETQTGYIIIREVDMNTLGVEVRRTDKIIAIDGETLEQPLFVWRVDKGSHYDGTFRLLRINFTDRQGVDG